MRAIGRSAAQAMLALLALQAASFGWAADPHAEIVDLVASMTAALADDNAAGFMKGIDKSLPEYGDLSRAVTALVVNYEITSSVEPLKDEPAGSKRSVDLDWYFELKSRSPGGPTIRRRQIIHCDVALQARHWRIVSLSPLSFFVEPLPK